MSDFIVMKADPGEQVSSFAARMVSAALRKNQLILGEFNQHTFEARPGSKLSEVLKPWEDAQRKSYKS